MVVELTQMQTTTQVLSVTFVLSLVEFLSNRILRLTVSPCAVLVMEQPLTTFKFLIAVTMLSNGSEEM